MKYIIAVPDHEFYLWQVLVQINNFRKWGIEKDAIYVVGTFNNVLTPVLRSFIANENIKAQFYTYRDTRVLKNYSSSLRPHILEKFFKDYPELGVKAFMYLDPDVIFLQKPDFRHLEEDRIWYVSDTRSYIDSEYIKSKGHGIFERMCEIVRIPKEVVQAGDKHAGGAQYIMKNITSDFWKKVYVDCERLYTDISRISKLAVVLEKRTILPDEPKKEAYNPLQIWCADMWAVLWNAWLFGNNVKIHKDLHFSWASNHIKDARLTKIFHNAGIVTEDGINFCKGTYQVSPFNRKIEVSMESASWYYLQEIKDTEKNFADLLY